MNKKSILIIGSMVIAVSIIGMIFLWQQQDQRQQVTSTSTTTSTTVVTPVEEVFSKTIYDPESGSLDVFKARCEAKKGKFNECGSPCGPEAEACILMCVYTCEFEQEKPDVSTTTTNKEWVVVGLGKSVAVFGLTITPEKILEDSRCPIDVVCIQAGTVRVKVQIKTSKGTEVRNLTLSEPISTSDLKVTLVEVYPTSKSSQIIVKPEEYRFVFEVVKN